MDDRELAAIFTVQTAGEALRKKGKKGNATFGKKEKKGTLPFYLGATTRAALGMLL